MTNHLKQLSQGLGLMLVTLLLLSCGASAVTSVAPTERQEPKDSSEVPRISPEDLKARLDNGEAILVVDTRSKTSFDSGHIAGAISVPAGEVESRLDEFPRDQEIVFYCT